VKLKIYVNRKLKNVVQMEKIKNFAFVNWTWDVLVMKLDGI
jgi:hypothetical protein